jgi:hypothetical protein
MIFKYFLMNILQNVRKKNKINILFTINMEYNLNNTSEEVLDNTSEELLDDNLELKSDIKNNSISLNYSDILNLKKKKLIEVSKNLTKIEYLEIFNIIQNDNCQYSENKNGIFINLSNVSENTIDKIFNFINFIKHKKEDLFKYEEYINIAKKNITDFNNKRRINTFIKDLNIKKSSLYAGFKLKPLGMHFLSKNCIFKCLLFICNLFI